MTGRFEKYCQDILPRTYIDALDAGDHPNAFRVVHFNWKLIVTPKAMFSPSSEHQIGCWAQYVDVDEGEEWSAWYHARGLRQPERWVESQERSHTTCL
jgi:hypothetical protein